MSHERFPRRVDLAIWFATLAFLGLAIDLAVAAPPPAVAAGIAPREAWQRECGDCHIAYPARLLPAADWRRIVATLDRHFGVDASLDAATTASISNWLEANAGRARREGTGEAREGERDERRSAATVPPAERPAAGGKATVATTQPPLPRISTTRWFLGEHDEIAAATWKRPAIGSPARCEACHTDAAQGRFSEHALSIPR
jgi:hypothetical protein